MLLVPAEYERGVGRWMQTAMSAEESEERAEQAEETPMWVKYNRLLHGRQTASRQKRDLLSTSFLKKYIHWCKFLKPPTLTGARVFQRRLAVPISQE